MQNVYSEKIYYNKCTCGFFTETIISIINFPIHKKLYKSFSVTSFVGGNKNFANCNERSHRNGQKLTKSKETFTISWNNKYEIYFQRVKNIFTEEFLNPFSNEMDETKLYIIKSGTYTSNDIGEWLRTIFERRKIWRVEFQKRITKTGSN